MITVREFKNILLGFENDWKVKFITGECPNFENLQIKTIMDHNDITKIMFEPTEDDTTISVGNIWDMFIDGKFEYNLISMMHTNAEGQIFDSIIELADVGHSDRILIIELIDR